MTTSSPPVDLARVEGAGGVVWSAPVEGVHTNLVVLDPGSAIGTHTNDALDVLVVVLAGAGTATLDGQEVALSATSALVLPRGTSRSIVATDRGLRYLTIHGARPPMTIGTARV